MALLEAFFTHSGPPPWEYIEMVLCRDFYHCTPSELAKENASKAMRHLIIANYEAKYLKAPKGGSKWR